MKGKETFFFLFQQTRSVFILKINI